MFRLSKESAKIVKTKKNVKIISTSVPTAKVMPNTSLSMVVPSAIDCGTFGKTANKAKLAIIEPASCEAIKNMASFCPIFLAASMAIVTAGLMCVPEIAPNA